MTVPIVFKLAFASYSVAAVVWAWSTTTRLLQILYIHENHNHKMKWAQIDKRKKQTRIPRASCGQEARNIHLWPHKAKNIPTSNSETLTRGT